ncbi:hypothetical protein F5X99DRAFT_241069 [Biscogniauxia marginata]|nr:hypothetical protein F5X99DRAFT_241069 [Biscogniauxia marginata]
MPVRIPGPRFSEVVTFGVAGVASFAPFYFMLPSGEDLLAKQTAKWAPRWERNISYFVPPAQRMVQRVEHPLERTVKRIDNRLPLETMAHNVEGRIKRGIDRAERYHKH